MSVEETFTNMNLPKNQFMIHKVTEKFGIIVDTLYVFYYRYYNFRSKSIEKTKNQTLKQTNK